MTVEMSQWRKRLFGDVRANKVRFLIGFPWLPPQIEQREGCLDLGAIRWAATSIRGVLTPRLEI
ncbi:hypothetical protein J5277_13540 [Rhizobium sp. 16-449-1b]|uniref:hypothetical protein n=1 Tax=Rhizobium sp. 16-449-1b TaxID=2819989 RepID=UPI001ADB9749|nr:hypothetical protein [Rhizobium sp. 16-449-1b]MBO9195128.1 hypothetical protein [Rhizobium sp. 16-449-1b]